MRENNNNTKGTDLKLSDLISEIRNSQNMEVATELLAERLQSMFETPVVDTSDTRRMELQVKLMREQNYAKELELIETGKATTLGVERLKNAKARADAGVPTGPVEPR